MVDQFVVPLPEGWGVRASTSREVLKVFETREQAIEFAHSQAEKQHASLFIQGKDGELTKDADYHKRENPVEIQSVMIGNEYMPRLDED
ncbi:MAG: DUF2188 domain-containing protein [Anaerolineae bacterium]